MTDIRNWLIEQRARLDAAQTIKRIAQLGPKLATDMKHPGAPFGASLTINCRCVIKPK
jgi:hypothetical protein